MDGKFINIVLGVLIGLFSIGILTLGFLMFRPKTAPMLPPPPKQRGGSAAADKEPQLEDFGLRLSQFMSPDSSKSAATPQQAGPPVMVGGGDLKVLSKPKGSKTRALKPKPKGKPNGGILKLKSKMKQKQRK